MKKYVKLKCAICARTKDELINNTHYAPDKCTITLGCEGRLFPIAYTSDGNSILGVPPSGSTNWYSRGSTLSANSTIQSEPLYDLSTGSKQQLIIAVEGSFPIGTTLTLNLLAEQQVAKDYRQYTYRKTGSFTTVSGLEDGSGKKTLRYSLIGATPDEVKVYVDGVLKTRGTGANQYQLYDGSSTSPVAPNSILFNTTIAGVMTQVDVIVSKASTYETTSLTFTRVINDEARIGIGAWEGVSSVENPIYPKRELFYCDFLEQTSFSVDVKYRLNPNVASTIGAVNLLLYKSAFLISRTEVYTQIDSIRTKWFPLHALQDDVTVPLGIVSPPVSQGYLISKKVNGIKTMMITEISSTDIFPPLTLNRFATPALISGASKGNNNSGELNTNLIIGPDS